MHRGEDSASDSGPRPTSPAGIRSRAQPGRGARFPGSARGLGRRIPRSVLRCLPPRWSGTPQSALAHASADGSEACVPSVLAPRFANSPETGLAPIATDPCSQAGSGPIRGGSMAGLHRVVGRLSANTAVAGRENHGRARLPPKENPRLRRGFRWNQTEHSRTLKYPLSFGR